MIRANHKHFCFLGEPGVSAIFKNTLEEVSRVAPTDVTVFITGETGTGKEIIAQSIHESSSRNKGPFIAVNCGAIPNELMGSEFFGYMDGAFTGARRSGFKGKFQQSQHGTIFLDEVSELSPSMQVSLLRVLENHKLTPLGSQNEVSLDIRVLAATHKNLANLVKDGQFREDLFYRLFVFPIHVPALRDRKEDIPFLVRYFCENRNWQVHLSKMFIATLQAYDWPGNVRELFNLLERLYIYALGEHVDLLELLQKVDFIKKNEPHPSRNITSLEAEVSQDNKLPIRDVIIKEMMITALRETKGNVMLAAKLLDIPRSTFYKRLRKYQL